MRFGTAILLAMASLSQAASNPDPNFDYIFKPSSGEQVPAGKVYSVAWNVPTAASKGPVTITLWAGTSSNDLQQVKTLATGVDNGGLKYNWQVDSTLGDKPLYGLRISLESDPSVHWQWSPGFKITGGAKAGATTSDASATTTSGTSSVTITSTATTSLKSSSVVHTTTTSTMRNNSTIVSFTPKPTTTSSSALGARATGGVAAAVVGGLAFAVLGL